MLIVSTIMVLLTTLVLANYREGSSQFALDRSAHRLAHELRRVSSFSLSAKEFQGSVPLTGYGIFIDRTWDNKKYRIYADTADANEFYTFNDSVIETIELEKGVFIKDITTSLVSRNEISVNFKAPDPAIKITHELGEAPDVFVILALESDDTISKQVNVNKAGLIAIEK